MSNTLYILKKREDMKAAQEAAQQEYDAFVAAFPQLDSIKVERAELHELYQPEGKVGYLIRVEVYAPSNMFHTIIQWAQKHIVCDVPVTWESLNKL